jgi:L-lysine exporter family protein LysE/ArgO
MNTFVAGLALGLSLILAIGAQNAFVLRQGLKQEHVFWVCLTCALSDALLMGLGVGGFHHIIEKFPWIDPVARYGGALFLLCYGFLRFKAVWLNRYAIEHSSHRPNSLFKTLLTTLAFTWLNPHVYLDTVVLIGSISTQYQPHMMLFWLGTVSASFVFFFSLGYGARLLKPYFETPRTWKILDILIGCVMWGLAVSLLTHR